MVLQDESGITKRKAVITNNDLILVDMFMAELQILYVWDPYEGIQLHETGSIIFLI